MLLIIVNGGNKYFSERCICQQFLLTQLDQELFVFQYILVFKYLRSDSHDWAKTILFL